MRASISKKDPSTKFTSTYSNYNIKTVFGSPISSSKYIAPTRNTNTKKAHQRQLSRKASHNSAKGKPNMKGIPQNSLNRAKSRSKQKKIREQRAKKEKEQIEEEIKRKNAQIEYQKQLEREYFQKVNKSQKNKRKVSKGFAMSHHKRVKSSFINNIDVQMRRANSPKFLSGNRAKFWQTSSKKNSTFMLQIPKNFKNQR